MMQTTTTASATSEQSMGRRTASPHDAPVASTKSRVLKSLLGVGTALSVAMGFLYLPPAQGFAVPELARMLAFHLPNAIAAVIAAFGGGYFAWRYLAKGRNPLDEVRSYVWAIVATLFCLLTTVTGMVFAQYQWGVPWNWDPKQTAMAILLVVYGAYFVLRAGVEDPEKRATVASAYMLFAAIMTPFLGYVAPKYLPSLHPTNTTFDSHYRTVITLASICFTGIAVWMYQIGTRYEHARMLLASAEAEIEG